MNFTPCEVTTRKISSDSWGDFVSLMRTDPQCSECWCLNHREYRGCATGALAQEKMKILVEQNKVSGILAYCNDLCVGWISIDPMSSLCGHDCSSTGKKGEWAIHCLFVRTGFRGRGVSTQLVESAVGFARERGARLISAFPIPAENRSNFPEGEAEFSGRFSTYSKLGFKSVGIVSKFYQRMELVFED